MPVYGSLCIYRKFDVAMCFEFCCECFAICECKIVIDIASDYEYCCTMWAVRINSVVCWYESSGFDDVCQVWLNVMDSALRVVDKFHEDGFVAFESCETKVSTYACEDCTNDFVKFVRTPTTAKPMVSASVPA